MDEPRSRTPVLWILAGASLATLGGLWIAIGPRPPAREPGPRDDSPPNARTVATELDAVPLSAAVPERTPRAAPPEPRIRGTLVDLSTGLPIAGRTIRLMAPPERDNTLAFRFGGNAGLDYSFHIESLQVNDRGGPVRIEFLNRPTPEPEVGVQPLFAGLMLERLQSAQFDIRPRVYLAEETIQTLVSPSPEVPSQAPAPEPIELQLRLASGLLPRTQGQEASPDDAPAGQGGPEAPKPEPAPAEPTGSPTGTPTVILPDLAVAVDALRSVALEKSIQNFVSTDRWTFTRASDRQPRVLGETKTDSEGAFEFPCTDVVGAWLELPIQDGTYVEPPSYDLPAQERACSEEIVWKVELRRGGIFRARVVDEATGEPVPALRAELTPRRGGRQTLMTDSEGRLASLEPLPAGPVDVAFLDGGERVPVAAGESSVEFDPATPTDSGPVFRVAIGPTYRFDVAGPEGADLSALCVRIAGLAAESVRPRDGEDLSDWRDLSSEEPRSIRISWPCHRTGSAIVAEVRTRDGSLAGRTELHHVRGISTWPARVDLEPRATIVGTVRGPQGRGVPGVNVRARQRDRALSAFDELARTDEVGRFEIRGLDPAEVDRVELEHDTFGSRTIPVELKPGETTTLDVDL